MNKIILTAVVALGLLAQSAFAAVPNYTFSASPLTQNVSGGTFQVTLSLQDSGPNNAAAFDIYIATAAANSGLFSITSATGQGVWTNSGPGSFSPDALNIAAASGFVRNNIDMGFSASSPQSAPFTQAIEILAFSYTAGPGTYTFSTTTTANAGGFYSDVSDSTGNSVIEGSPGTFTITIVPEPATWSLLGLGGLATVGLNVLRRRRAS